MDAYRQHSASMFLVKRHGKHCTRVCGATGSGNCSVLCEHGCDRIMPAKGRSTHCRQDFYHSVSRGVLQRGECAGATVFHVKHRGRYYAKPDHGKVLVLREAHRRSKAVTGATEVSERVLKACWVTSDALQGSVLMVVQMFHIKHPRQVLCGAKPRQGFAYEGGA